MAYISRTPVITLGHPQQVHPHLEGVVTGDSITIQGEPTMHFVSSPEIPGSLGTVALAVNMIPHVLHAAPGLTCMADLPAPAAIMGDAAAARGEKRGCIFPIRPGVATLRG